MITVWLAAACVLTMLVAGVLVLTQAKLLGAIAAASVVSVALSVLLVILRAPDVALAEAAVGAGLSSVLLALALRRVGAVDDSGEEH